MLLQNSVMLLKLLRFNRSLLRVSSKLRECNRRDRCVVLGSFNYYSVKACHAAVNNHSDTFASLHERKACLSKVQIESILDKFCSNKTIHQLLKKKGLSSHVQYEVSESFRAYCTANHHLPEDLHAVFSSGNHLEILTHFLQYAKEVFPHLECMEGWSIAIPDLRNPTLWYPEARSRKRKIIFHTGPTNSGKTHRALQHFLKAKSGVYCGPLKLLASEVATKTNQGGIPCDLVTGEEKKFIVSEENPASHMACTTEMLSTRTLYDVAVIDEIQLIGDYNRGWAWTRALLGVNANEVHLCGEEGALELIKDICLSVGETVDVKRYNRLTNFKVEDNALESFENIQPGDCVICFKKKDLYEVTRAIKALGKKVAVIYGDLPPNIKLMQAQEFNDLQNDCKVLVATDAIGMGLNLNIRRIIFYSLEKPILGADGRTTFKTISVSQALQISGRAGRLGTHWKEGLATTYASKDLKTLQHILTMKPEPVLKAGLCPTACHIETYGYNLPNLSLTNLMDKFTDSCQVDSLYFICNMKTLKKLSALIDDVPLPLHIRYKFCWAPVNFKSDFACDIFVKFAWHFTKKGSMEVSWLLKEINWPFEPPKTLKELEHLVNIFEVLDLYLWLSNHFGNSFAEQDLVPTIKNQLEVIIQKSIVKFDTLSKMFKFGITSRIHKLLEDPKTNSCDQTSISRTKLENPPPE